MYIAFYLPCSTCKFSTQITFTILKVGLCIYNIGVTNSKFKYSTKEHVADIECNKSDIAHQA